MLERLHIAIDLISWSKCGIWGYKQMQHNHFICIYLAIESLKPHSYEKITIIHDNPDIVHRRMQQVRNNNSRPTRL